MWILYLNSCVAINCLVVPQPTRRRFHNVVNIRVPFIRVALDIDEFPGVHRSRIRIKSLDIRLLHPACSGGRKRDDDLLLRQIKFGFGEFFIAFLRVNRIVRFVEDYIVFRIVPAGRAFVDRV